MHGFQSILVVTATTDTSLWLSFGIDPQRPSADRYMVDQTTSIGIDLIRDIHRFAAKPPLIESQKNVVLQHAELLTIEAQNALLKLLEEPPEYLRILLIAPYVHPFCDTLLSRCQIVIRTHTGSPLSIDMNTLTTLLSQPPSARIRLAAQSTKSRDLAIETCRQVLAAAEFQFLHTPNQTNLHNLTILNRCIINLEKNANPSTCLSDAFLRLTWNLWLFGKLATMAKLNSRLVERIKQYYIR